MLGVLLDSGPYLQRLCDELARVDQAALRRWSDLIYQAWRQERFVFLIGNGGSGLTASHMCEDLGKGTLSESDLLDESKKRLKVLESDRQCGLDHGDRQRFGLRPDLRPATDELRLGGRRLDRHQRVGQQPQRPEGGRLGQPARVDDVSA
jgi:hypothetical protein